ncbi:alanine racemase [Schizosaccharomyces japonicus yFS275]|uniref:D-serine dehydratase n=1 Tax=Schizosaccharomyces japonicus (strain yFS275 / FY16936) TaxID=402676 RepID=B6K7V4_SCHJY|nr:alanine racemase [Schizosaccharomyces japonicus yFS275]EEB09608.1 alanine racemase [Schizosaccharomyces japonicus yFS275]
MDLDKFGSKFYVSPSKDALKKKYVGISIYEIPTPAFVVDQKVVKNNCDEMLKSIEATGALFRPHVKTHKCIEAMDLQLQGRVNAVVVSTIREAIAVVASGKVDDILYGLPVCRSRLEELYELSKNVKSVRLLIDNLAHIDILKQFAQKHSIKRPFSVFIKIDMGTSRAGLQVGSPELQDLIDTTLNASGIINLFGFYCHAGHSYGASSIEEARNYLLDEIRAANVAAEYVHKKNRSTPLVLSVGATPTAHATKAWIADSVPKLYGRLEIHTGNYAFCDLQQAATGCVSVSNIACSVMAEVISTYPNRKGAPGEALVNAGVISLSRENGRIPGFGNVITEGLENWYVDRLSQEHGILRSSNSKDVLPRIGQLVRIVPQHACITANAFTWYFVTDGGDIITDIWVPWRGW